MEEETSPTSSSPAREENLSRSSGYASLNGIDLSRGKDVLNLVHPELASFEAGVIPQLNQIVPFQGL
ncbi:MAG: hypothetical protein JO034_17445 [Singulisphaera sp.]|nr:hypothetical protein [Singulisphaera sp.]